MRRPLRWQPMYQTDFSPLRYVQERASKINAPWSLMMYIPNIYITGQRCLSCCLLSCPACCRMDNDHVGYTRIHTRPEGRNGHTRCSISRGGRGPGSYSIWPRMLDWSSSCLGSRRSPLRVLLSVRNLVWWGGISCWFVGPPRFLTFCRRMECFKLN